MKTCSKCKITKPIEEFVRDKKRTDNLYPHCKICVKQYKKENKEKIDEYKKIYVEQNKDKTKKDNSAWNHKNPHYHSEYRKENKDKISKRERERLKNDPLYRMKRNIRSRICKSLKLGNIIKSDKTLIILGIASFNDLISYFGRAPLNNEHIDHICPLSQAQNEEEVVKLNHYTNLKLLPAQDNLSKSDSWTPEGAELCRILLNREWVL